jgi:hypothetical protein
MPRVSSLLLMLISADFIVAVEAIAARKEHLADSR